MTKSFRFATRHSPFFVSPAETLSEQHFPTLAWVVAEKRFSWGRGFG